MRLIHQPLSIIILTAIFSTAALADGTWRGLVVKSEDRCTPYNKKNQYPYPQSVEDEVVESMGGLIYGPYTGRHFEADTLTDIEHIVAASEGHDSGLCSASPELRKQFATDVLNLTLAHKDINRCDKSYGKCGYDAGEWLPEKNKCWFANRIIEIKQKYGLSVDENEARALDDVLAQCSSFEMIIYKKSEENYVALPEAEDALAKYDTNGNKRITCSEAREHRIAPVKEDHPAYQFMNDRDNDGVVCE